MRIELLIAWADEPVRLVCLMEVADRLCVCVCDLLTHLRAEGMQLI